MTGRVPSSWRSRFISEGINPAYCTRPLMTAC